MGAAQYVRRWEATRLGVEHELDFTNRGIPGMVGKKREKTGFDAIVDVVGKLFDGLTEV